MGWRQSWRKRSGGGGWSGAAFCFSATGKGQPDNGLKPAKLIGWLACGGKCKKCDSFAGNEGGVGSEAKRQGSRKHPGFLDGADRWCDGGGFLLSGEREGSNVESF